MLLLPWLPVLLRRLLEAACKGSEEVLKAASTSTSKHGGEVEIGSLLLPAAATILPEIEAALATTWEVPERLLVESAASLLLALEALLA